MSDTDLKRRLASYTLANEQYRLTRGHVLALELGMQLAKEVGTAHPLRALRTTGRLGALTVAQVLRMSNIRMLRRYLASQPPEVTLTQDDLGAMGQAPEYDDAAVRGAEWWATFGTRDETLH